MSEKPAAFQAVDELEANVTSEQDRADLEAWRREIEAERASLGDMKAPNLHQNPDGSIVTAQEHQEALTRGDNPSETYNHGRRG